MNLLTRSQAYDGATTSNEALIFADAEGLPVLRAVAEGQGLKCFATSDWEEAIARLERRPLCVIAPCNREGFLLLREAAERWPEVRRISVPEILPVLCIH